MVLTFSQGVMSSLAKARKDDYLTDYAFVCGGERLPVHKVVVTVQSVVFRTACKDSFKEASGAYEIKDFPVSAVKHLVTYLYTGKYSVPVYLDDKKTKRNCPASPLVDHATMFAMADRYWILGLDVLATATYRKLLFDPEFSDFEGFLFSIPVIYKSTPASFRGLRDVAVKFATFKHKAMVAHKEDFQKLKVAIPEFADDLLDAFMFPTGQANA